MNRHDENRIWERFNAAQMRQDRRRDVTPLLIVALAFSVACMAAVVVAG